MISPGSLSQVIPKIASGIPQGLLLGFYWDCFRNFFRDSYTSYSWDSPRDSLNVFVQGFLSNFLEGFLQNYLSDLSREFLQDTQRDFF